MGPRSHYSIASLVLFSLLLPVTFVVADSVDNEAPSSVSVLTSEEIEQLPIKSLEELLLLQNGAIGVKTNYDQIGVPRDTRERQTGADVHIRGGQRYANDFRVNGLSFRNGMSGLYTASISPYAIEQFSLTPGVPPASYGNVGTGIVGVRTTGQATQMQGTVEAVSDDFTTGYGRNWYTASFATPIQGMDGVTLAATVERRWFGDRTPSPKTDDWLPGSPDRLPNNTLDGWSYHGKLTYEMTPETRLTLFADGSTDEWQEYRQEFLFAPAHNPRYKDENLGIGASFEHRLSDKVTWSLTGGYVHSERTHGDGVLFDDLAAYVSGVVNPMYDDWLLFRRADSDTSVYDYFLHYMSDRVGFSSEVRVDLKDDQQMQVGAEAWRLTNRYFENLAPTRNPSSIRVNRYGYDIDGNESNDEGWMNEAPHPLEAGVWMSGRFEADRLILLPGLRIDYFDFDATQLRDVQQPFGADNTTLDEEDVVDVDPFVRLSPRLYVVVPVTDRRSFHVGFAMTYQAPPYRLMHVGWDFFEERVEAGVYSPFGVGEVEPERTTQIEAGLSSQATDNLRLRVTGFYNDFVRTSGLFHQSAVPTAYDYYSSYGEGHAAGVEVDLAYRESDRFGCELTYTFSDIRANIGRIGTSYQIVWQYKEIQLDPDVADFNLTHTLSGLVHFSLGKDDGPRIGNTSVLGRLSGAVIARLWSGLPYTRLSTVATGREADIQAVPAGEFNAERTDWTWSIDLKLEREIPFGQVYVTPFVWVKNLLNTENVTSVYWATGLPDEDGYLATPEGQVIAESTNGAEFVELYNLKQHNPLNYGEPRQIYLGLRVSF